MFSTLIENLMGLGWALLLSTFAFVVFTLPFVTWVEVSRALLRPLLIRMSPQRRAVQFRLTDVACLLTELSVLGMLTARIVAIPLHLPAAVLFLVLMSVLAVVAWHSAVAWLTRTGVSGLLRRAVFQMFVVPTALFFPVLFLLLAIVAAQLLQRGTELDGRSIASALFLAALGTSLLMSGGRRLAAWVALGART